MEQFIGTGISGIPYGCTYAIVAVGLVLTYQATGVFNFAFGAQAFASAFIFTWLVQEHGFPVWASFVLSVIVLGPALGLTFDRFLFRRIPSTNTTAKIVTGIALLVGIPSLLPVVFGNQNLYNAPSVLFNINPVYFRVAGQPINGISVSSVLFTAVVLAAVVLLMRCTTLGLQMRAAVESRRLLQLDGVNAGGVVAVAHGMPTRVNATAPSVPSGTIGGASSSTKRSRYHRCSTLLPSGGGGCSMSSSQPASAPQ